MTNNKYGPNEGITQGIRQLTDTRGDPDIGRYKRGKERAEMLIANRLTGNIQPE